MTESRRIALYASLLTLLALLVFLPSVSPHFTNWDDTKLVRDNPAIRSLSPANLIAIFTPQAGKTYQPLRVLSYALDFILWGGTPRSYRLVNIALHALASILLFLALRQFLPRLYPALPHATDIAAFAAALFCVHPVNVEAVAWISSRKYGLLATFTFAAWLALLNQRRALAAAATVAATLSSPFGLVAPALLWLSARQTTSTPARHVVPSLIASALVLPIILYGLLMGSSDSNALADGAAPFVRAVIMLESIFLYLRNLLAPFWLSARYELAFSGLSLAAALGAAILTAALLLALRTWRHKPPSGLFFGIAWIAISLAPVSNLIPISTPLADRYLYLAAVPVWIGTALMLARLPRRWAIITSATLILSLAGLSGSRARIWRDSLALWQNAQQINPQSPIALTNLGRALEETGQYQQAAALYHRALTIRPTEPGIHNCLAHNALLQGRPQQAIPHAETALALKPGFYPARVNLAQALLLCNRPEDSLQLSQAIVQDTPNASNLLMVAQAAQKLGQLKLAHQSIQQGLQLAPDNPRLLSEAAFLAILLNDLSTAREIHTKTQALAPGAPEVLANEGMLKLAAGQPAAAIPALRQALATGDRRLNTHFALAQALARSGQPQAARALSHSLTIQYPQTAVVWLNHAALLRQASDQLPAAIHAYKRAIHLGRDDVNTRATLAQLLLDAKRPAEAAAAYTAALKRQPDNIHLLCRLAVAQLQQGNPSQARQTLAAAALQAPHHPTVQALQKHPPFQQE